MNKIKKWFLSWVDNQYKKELERAQSEISSLEWRLENAYDSLEYERRRFSREHEIQDEFDRYKEKAEKDLQKIKEENLKVVAAYEIMRKKYEQK